MTLDEIKAGERNAMSLQERAAQAADLEHRRRAADADRFRAECKARDIDITRRWWNETIGEPRAEFWLPARWSPSDQFKGGLVTCDGWAIIVELRRHREQFYGRRPELANAPTGYVITGVKERAWGSDIAVHKGSFASGRITSFARLGELLTEIGDPPDIDFGALMLADEPTGRKPDGP